MLEVIGIIVSFFSLAFLAYLSIVKYYDTQISVRLLFFIFWMLSVTILIVSTRAAVLMSGSPFWIEVFGSINLLLLILMGFFFIHIQMIGVMVHRDVSSFDGFMEAIENMSPREGLEYLQEYLNDPKWSAPEGEFERFLTWLSTREDIYGELAQEILKENDEKSLPG
ncbi:MAG: hypothetical protein GF411_01370 [Candidatus Lokiarchaeota archaeon]|nr:hypothetical protein [Candidatus Lokiarchaeota archaeon]